MNVYTFATQSKKAYYCNTISGFITDKPNDIIGQLVTNSFEINKSQVEAWERQIVELQKRLQNAVSDGDIIFEYDIVRLGKRIDVIVLLKRMVFSLEFKNGKSVYTAEDAQQAEDYATDIKNFHKESEDLYVCPILIATDAPRGYETAIVSYPDKQISLQKENIDSLIPKINRLVELYGTVGRVDFAKWFHSPYYPTPTIIAAAVEAYRTHEVHAIARSEAGQANIDCCEAQLEDIINYAEREHKKCICFVTGVPGAGKTLVGLDVVAKSLERGTDRLSVYLSGNGPLVTVLRQALKDSERLLHKEQGSTKKVNPSGIEALIQGSYAFKEEYLKSKRPIPEHILIFDEAQRGWSRDKMKKAHADNEAAWVSEPELLYQIMDAHTDWAVIICLVGLGQDIYDGEVGIYEWIRAGIETFTDWELYYSPEVLVQSADKGIDTAVVKACTRCKERVGLHLHTSIRSFRASTQSQFVDALLANQPAEARRLYATISNKYPIYITRNLSAAKRWAKAQVRGSQRCGLLASSGAIRLRPDGIYVSRDIDVKSWFLAPSTDIRSSNKLEIPAREFDIQGLEIDWAVLGWDADLRREGEREWGYYSFRGSKWQRRRKEEQQRYLLNSYRVLLTRARQGLVIFVPEGEAADEDPTRDRAFYDGIYEYLLACGLFEL